MPKAEKGSIKDLGKRMKAKGLQKLKFYCQMCEKQCRDANGFKCHLTSESHLRGMKLFSENSKNILYQNSKQFEKCFLDNLRMRHSTAQVNANHVYQQVISDKQHVHMNGTYWSSLAGFVQYLGKTGKCHIEETERGWYITYINRDVDKMQREEAQRKRQVAEMEAEAATQKRMEHQRVEAAKALDRAGGVLKVEASSILNQDHGATASIQLQAIEKPKRKKLKRDPGNLFDEEEDDEEKKEVAAPESSTEQAKSVAKPASSTQQTKGTRAWLYPNIWVRIINKDFHNGDYFRTKARVDRLVDEYTAQCSVDTHCLRLDQDDLETVVPKKAGERVRIVRGPHRGQKAVAIRLDKSKCKATLELKDGTVVERVSYDDFSRLA